MNPPYNLLASLLNTRIQIQEFGLHLFITEYFFPVVNTALHCPIYLIALCFVESRSTPWLSGWKFGSQFSLIDCEPPYLFIIIRLTQLTNRLTYYKYRFANHLIALPDSHTNQEMVFVPQFLSTFTVHSVCLISICHKD